MKMNIRAKGCLPLLAFLLMVTSLTSCGGTTQPSPTPISKPTPTAAATPTTAAKPSGNQPPVIKSLTSELTGVVPGDVTTVKCDASDPDGDALTYAWSSNGGSFNPAQGLQPYTVWTAPNYAGDFVINLTVADGKGGSATGSLKITASANRPPVISSINVLPATLKRGDTGTITCTASDPDGNPLTYTWHAAGGSLSGSGSVVTWKAPSADGIYKIEVSVDDGKGGVTPGSISITVQNPTTAVTLTPVAAESGSVDSNGGISTSYIVGDSDTDAGVMAYFSFDISGLAGADIKSATLTFTPQGTTGNPWFVPPFLYVEQVDYGTRAIKAGDFNMTTTYSQMGKYDSQVPGPIDVQFRLTQMLSKSRFQVRLRMASNSNFNKMADVLQFAKAEIAVTYIK